MEKFSEKPVYLIAPPAPAGIAISYADLLAIA
jgi:hypothetical protein